jgi:hypothetical protein
MLKSPGKPLLFLHFRRWTCVCLLHRQLGPALRARLRPLVIGRFACWIDRTDPGASLAA